MNIEDLKKETLRRENLIVKLDEEISELEKKLNNVTDSEKKGLENKIATRKAKREAELGSLKFIYTSIIKELRQTVNSLNAKLKRLNNESNEYANTVIERNKIVKEINEFNRKLNNLNGKTTKKVVNVEEGNEKTRRKAPLGLLIAVSAVLGTGFLANTIACTVKYVTKANNNTKTNNGKSCAPVTVAKNVIGKIKNNNGEELEVVVTPTPTEKPFESYGEFIDASDPKQLEARAKWYMETYNLNGSITLEELVDALSIFNGELPIDGKFENETLMLTNNKVVNAFIFANSTFDDVKKGTRKFVPLAPMFTDGSHEQECAKELDQIMEPLIKAMNEHNNEDFIKYATEFGILMRDQYYLVSNTSDHKGVRGLVPSTQATNLYSFEYAQYSGNILWHCIENNINICIPFCFDHETGEIVYVPLAKLMVTLDMIPMNEWDAVLQRSGLTTDDIEKLGNGSVEDTMIVIFVRDSKEHFKEKQQELNDQKALRLG